MRFPPCFIPCFLSLTGLFLAAVTVSMAQGSGRGSVSAGRDGFAAASEAQAGTLSANSVDQPPGVKHDLSNEGGQEPQSAKGQQPDSSVSPSTASVHGTVTDVYGDLIPSATVVLEGAAGDRQTALASGNAAFQFEHLKPGIAYHVRVTVKGFEDWTSPVLILNPGQYFI
ncbi:MAG: carboxypeptidase-like regulatory domain-containing protein, partial [Terracidiphilus sp.]